MSQASAKNPPASNNPPPTGPEPRSATKQPPSEPGYAEALSELESILAELERDNVDVDVLASRVQRAAELIRLCRERIGNARLQIEQVVAELDR